MAQRVVSSRTKNGKSAANRDMSPDNMPLDNTTIDDTAAHHTDGAPVREPRTVKSDAHIDEEQHRASDAVSRKRSSHGPKKVRISRSSKSSPDKPVKKSRTVHSRRAQSAGSMDAAARGDATTVEPVKSEAGGFVDARELASEDLVEKTLKETSNRLGVAARPKIIDFDERLHERRKANMRTIAVRITAIVAAIAVIAGLVWLCLFSSVFRLESSQIQVSGANEWVSKERIHAIADKQSGTSLLLVSGSKVIEQLKDIPGVTNATVSKDFPKGLKVTVEAQRPAAMLKASDDSLTAVDSRGRVLNAVDGTSADGIPVIEVANVDTGLQNRAVKEALKILNSLPEQMRTSITKVSAQTQDSVTTELDSGNRIIVWGDSSDLKLKKAVVDKIINDPTKIGDKHQVDVSAPLRPIIK